jgi:hypothetical protein
MTLFWHGRRGECKRLAGRLAVNVKGPEDGQNRGGRRAAEQCHRYIMAGRGAAQGAVRRIVDGLGRHIMKIFYTHELISESSKIAAVLRRLNISNVNYARNSLRKQEKPDPAQRQQNSCKILLHQFKLTIRYL